MRACVHYSHLCYAVLSHFRSVWFSASDTVCVAPLSIPIGCWLGLKLPKGSPSPVAPRVGGWHWLLVTALTCDSPPKHYQGNWIPDMISSFLLNEHSKSDESHIAFLWPHSLLWLPQNPFYWSKCNRGGAGSCLSSRDLALETITCETISYWDP